MNAATAPSTRTAAGLKTKFTPVTRSFLRSQIDPKLGWFLMMLEDLSMDRTMGFDDYLGNRLRRRSPAHLRFRRHHRPVVATGRERGSTGGALPQARADRQGGTHRVYLAPTAHRSARRHTGHLGPGPGPARGRRRRAQGASPHHSDTCGGPLHLPQICGCTYRRFAGAPTADLRGIPGGATNGARACSGRRQHGKHDDDTGRVVVVFQFISDSDPRPGKARSRRDHWSSRHGTDSGRRCIHSCRARKSAGCLRAAGRAGDRPGPPEHRDRPHDRPVGALQAAPNWSAAKARDFILGLVRLFHCPLWWVYNAIEQAHQRRDPARGKKAVEKAVYVRNTVERWTKGDGDPGEEPPLGKTSGLDSPARASPSRRNEARQVLDALRGSGLDIEAKRVYCQDTSQTSWSYALKGDRSQLAAEPESEIGGPETGDSGAGPSGNGGPSWPVNRTGEGCGLRPGPPVAIPSPPW